ncbi:hypothetical protein DH2020_003486 [Rehmannia glutinosa]|uniref:glutathione transferase n=1 Tax=Rehmannia glutinosa TaxID=99300 RepID=A0ABR0XLS4_REHGL
MAKGNVQLLGSWVSPYSNRVQMVLNLKSVDYEFIEENFYSNKSERLLKANPVHKKIPVLIHDEKPILSKLNSQWFPCIWVILLSDGEEAKKIDAVEEFNKGLALLEDAFTKCSKGQKFFGGDKIGYLDIALGCFLGLVRLIQKMDNTSLIDESKTPNLFKWAQHFSAHHAIKVVIPETEKLLEFAKVFVAQVKASGINK